jgi:hypothetical protein
VVVPLVLLVTVTVIVCDDCRPPLSVTRATMVCEPAARSCENDPPWPIHPPLSVHCTDDVRLPSWLSDAEPLKDTYVPSAKLALLLGVLMVTVGAELVGAGGGGSGSAEPG